VRVEASTELGSPRRELPVLERARLVLRRMREWSA
jgi:hypothetical protein